MVHSGFNKVHHSSLFTVQLRCEDPHAEDKSEWVDLLYDLVFVAFAFAMSTTISHSELTFYNNFIYFCMVSYFWSSWLFVTNIRNTFSISGLLHYVAVISNMVGHAGSACELDPELHLRRSFAYWRLLILASEVLISLAILHQCPRGRSWIITNFLFYLVPSIVCCMVFIVLPYTDDTDEEDWRHIVCAFTLGIATIFFWGIHAAIHLLLHWVRFVAFPPFSFSLFMMRLEEVTMILLGETFIAVVAMTMGVHHEEIRTCGVICFILVFCAGSWYFASQPHDPTHHPISQGKLRGLFAFLLYRGLGTVIFFFGCYVKTMLYLMKIEYGVEGHRRLSSTSSSNHGSSTTSSSVSSATSSSTSSAASGSSASSSPGHASSGHGSGHEDHHPQLDIAVHMVLGGYIALMCIINTTHLLQKFKGDSKAWSLNLALVSVRYAFFLALFGLWPLGEEPVATCFSLLGAEFGNIAIGFMFTHFMRKPSLPSAKVHPDGSCHTAAKLVHPESPLVARAEDALHKLQQAAEAHASLRKAVDASDAETIANILESNEAVRQLTGNRRKSVFHNHLGQSSSTDSVPHKADLVQ